MSKAADHMLRHCCSPPPYPSSALNLLISQHPPHTPSPLHYSLPPPPSHDPTPPPHCPLPSPPHPTLCHPPPPPPPSPLGKTSDVQFCTVNVAMCKCDNSSYLVVRWQVGNVVATTLPGTPTLQYENIIIFRILWEIFEKVRW